jgi:endonuclease YncB( thermonuclease family)
MVPSLAFAVLVGSSYASTFDASVVRVVDGDSLIVLADRQELRVRLKEIDAPELKQSFGKRSRQSLADMCAAKRARVVWPETEKVIDRRRLVLLGRLVHKSDRTSFNCLSRGVYKVTTYSGLVERRNCSTVTSNNSHAC